MSSDVGIRSREIDFIEMQYSIIIQSLNDAANATISRLRVGALKFWWDQELDTLKYNFFVSHRTIISVDRCRKTSECTRF